MSKILILLYINNGYPHLMIHGLIEDPMTNLNLCCEKLFAMIWTEVKRASSYMHIPLALEHLQMPVKRRGKTCKIFSSLNKHLRSKKSVYLIP